MKTRLIASLLLALAPCACASVPQRRATAAPPPPPATEARLIDWFDPHMQPADLLVQLIRRSRKAHDNAQVAEGIAQVTNLPLAAEYHRGRAEAYAETANYLTDVAALFPPSKIERVVDCALPSPRAPRVPGPATP